MDELFDALARRALVTRVELGRSLVASQKLRHLLQELLPQAYRVDPLFHWRFYSGAIAKSVASRRL
jgi:hypothetical protein